MIAAVLDASVVIKWFRTEDEDNLDPARRLRARFEAGELYVLAPPLLAVEMLNVAGRRWRWREPELKRMATALTNLGFDLVTPDLELVAEWTGRGLTAYDACYVAVASTTGSTLITDDREILATAPELAEPLASGSG